MAYEFSNSYMYYLVLEVVAACDVEAYRSTSIETVYEHMDAGDLVQWLSATFRPECDLSMLDPDAGDHTEEMRESVRVERDRINAAFQDMYLARSGQHRRKWGIEHSGLLLVAAWGTSMLYERMKETPQ